MQEFYPFAMERMCSKYEQTVEYNLSESGVHPVSLDELLAGNFGSIDGLLATELNYPYVNGMPELRERIAALYEGAAAENVLVTVGAAEANYISMRTLLSEGDGIVVMLPNYMQIFGIAKNHGLEIKTFHLLEKDGWRVDLDELNESVTADTKLIAVCNPNNPTGHILTEAEMKAVVASAERVGAWILADEVYRGSERVTDVEAPSFYGMYDRVLAIGGLSKAYGLPGLRIGWIACPNGVLEDIWSRHEYTTISASMLSNRLAAIALSPECRRRLIRRGRDLIRDGYGALYEWMKRHESTFEFTPPQASAVAFIRYTLDVNSTAFAERLRKEKSVLIVPGDHFGMDNLVRISFGMPRDRLIPGLDRIRDLIAGMKR